MACYNPDAEEYQSVCRVMTGFTDSFYKEVSTSYMHRTLLLLYHLCGEAPFS